MIESKTIYVFTLLNTFSKIQFDFESCEFKPYGEGKYIFKQQDFDILMKHLKSRNYPLDITNIDYKKTISIKVIFNRRRVDKNKFNKYITLISVDKPIKTDIHDQNVNNFILKTQYKTLWTYQIDLPGFNLKDFYNDQF